MDEYQTQCHITADHPALPGHFPGAPLVPGVVILERVAGAVVQWLGGGAVAAVQSAKFVSPLLPQQPLTISLRRKGEETVAFRCHVGERLVAQGSLALQGRP
ncbi:MAG: 3-hydroxyacyl-ACP dehydratase FabZ family protein [Pseudomonadota bacterium]